MKPRLVGTLASAILAGIFVVGGALPSSAATVVDVPTDVTSALDTFPSDPEAAMTAWATWAATQPMTTRITNPGIDRTDCQIDPQQVAKCTSYQANPSGKKWVRDQVTYTNGKTQVFKNKGKWVRNNYGADNNPITNTDRFYSYDYWTPWTTPGVTYDASVGTDGWYTIQSQNPKVGDDQFPVLMVKVSPDGTRAQFLQQYQDGKVAVQQTLTLRDVPRINIPQSTKQRM